MIALLIRSSAPPLLTEVLHRRLADTRTSADDGRRPPLDLAAIAPPAVRCGGIARVKRSPRSPDHPVDKRT
jgi:hypothetical protein